MPKKRDKMKHIISSLLAGPAFQPVSTTLLVLITSQQLNNSFIVSFFTNFLLVTSTMIFLVSNKLNLEEKLTLFSRDGNSHTVIQLNAALHQIAREHFAPKQTY